MEDAGAADDTGIGDVSGGGYGFDANVAGMPVGPNLQGMVGQSAAPDTSGFGGSFLERALAEMNAALAQIERERQERSLYDPNPGTPSVAFDQMGMPSITRGMLSDINAPMAANAQAMVESLIGSTLMGAPIAGLVGPLGPVMGPIASSLAKMGIRSMAGPGQMSPGVPGGAMVGASPTGPPGPSMALGDQPPPPEPAIQGGPFTRPPKAPSLPPNLTQLPYDVLAALYFTYGPGAARRG